MEEQRIGMMYVNLIKRWFVDQWDRLFSPQFRRSSLFFWIMLLGVIAVPLVGWRLHKRGQFSTLKREIKGEKQGPEEAAIRPGGLAPLLLSRQRTPGGTAPELLSATILPGLGMGLLQVTAYLPGRGEIQLLSGPPLEEMAGGTTGSSQPRTGMNDLRGAIEVPWAGGITGVISPLGTTLTTNWHGRTIEIPTDPERDRALAEGGLLQARGADSSQAAPAAGGAQATGKYDGTDFEGHWPSRTETSITMEMGAHSIDLTVRAKNVGDQPEPAGIGWHPRFAIANRNRSGVELKLPSAERLEPADRSKGTFTGRMLAAGPALERFMARPATLGAESLDESLGHLKSAAPGQGAVAEYRDPASGYGLRLAAGSGSIQMLRVTSPVGAEYVSLGMQTNLDDPLGKEWTGEEGILTLQPGQTLEWKVRLEIFAVAR